MPRNQTKNNNHNRAIPVRDSVRPDLTSTSPNVRAKSLYGIDGRTNSDEPRSVLSIYCYNLSYKLCIHALTLMLRRVCCIFSPSPLRSPSLHASRLLFPVIKDPLRRLPLKVMTPCNRLPRLRTLQIIHMSAKIVQFRLHELRR